MKLRISAETYIPPEKRIYVDMDGDLVDFDSGVNRLQAPQFPDWDTVKDYLNQKL